MEKGEENVHFKSGLKGLIVLFQICTLHLTDVFFAGAGGSTPLPLRKFQISFIVFSFKTFGLQYPSSLEFPCIDHPLGGWVGVECGYFLERYMTMPNAY